MATKIVPFHSDMLPQAGALLAQRHQRDRIALPLLPERFGDPAVASAAIAAALQRPHSSGVAALDGERLVAYMIGDVDLNEIWGRSAWVRNPGCAYAVDSDAQLVGELYAVLGERWVRAGIFTHFALLPVADPALTQAWFSLSFGIEQVYALLDLAAHDSAPPVASIPVTVRQATPQDSEALAAISDVIWRHQVQAPVWGAKLPESVRETADGWAEIASDEEATVWLAFQGEQLVGMQGYWPSETADDDLLVADQCIELSVGGTSEAVRGQGINSLLTQHGLAHARDNGYRVCQTDWRSTNLLSSRFWPRRGFVPAVYRLVRRIDPRIAWADGAAL